MLVIEAVEVEFYGKQLYFLRDTETSVNTVLLAS